MAVLNPSLSNVIRLCNAHAHQLLYHPASVADIHEDRDVSRRQRTLARIRQYSPLEQGAICPWNTPETSGNDARDNEILWALYNDACHALVTEDIGIHRKARALGLSERVYFIQTANDWLERLHEPNAVFLPNIDDVELHTLTTELPGAFFDSIRNDYAPFDEWFRSKARDGRRAWVYRESGETISAICIYAVQRNERITDDGLVLPRYSLKLCTFKVGEAVRGRKVGELFLRAAFKYATTHRCESIFLHANSERQKHLTNLIEDFGFSLIGQYNGDGVYVKEHPITAPDSVVTPFEYVRKFYPHCMMDESISKFLVPIMPQYHRTLFPDWQSPGAGLPETHPGRHVGNAIKLAYLCHTPNKQPRQGDIVLFYRSWDKKALTSIAVVEKYVLSSSAADIMQQVSRRTVYSMDQITEMARKPTRVMLFRLIEHFENPVTLETLVRERCISRAPVSIMKISHDTFSRIITRSRGQGSSTVY